PLPAFDPKSAHHAVGRSRRERGQTKQRHKAKRQAVSVHDFARDFAPIEHLVDNIKSEMRGGIGKGTDPNHPTHAKKLVIAQDSAQRPHRERDEQEYQCPIAGAVDQISDRPRIESNRVGIANHLAERREQTHQRDDTERRYAVAGVAPNFERVSQPIFPDELGNDVDDNNRQGLREAKGWLLCLPAAEPWRPANRSTMGSRAVETCDGTIAHVRAFEWKSGALLQLAFTKSGELA